MKLNHGLEGAGIGRSCQVILSHSAFVCCVLALFVLLRRRFISFWWFLSLSSDFLRRGLPSHLLRAPCGAMSLPPLRSDIVCAAVLCADLVFTFVVFHLDPHLDSTSDSHSGLSDFHYPSRQSNPANNPQIQLGTYEVRRARLPPHRLPASG
jgi:hypothetical protein